MALSFASSWFRPILAALLALAFVAAPLAEDAHAAEPSIVCFVDHGADAAEPADTDQSGGHKHAVHHCGACHHHILRTADALPPGLRDISTRFSLTPDNAMLNAPPYELLRPPRV